MGERKKMAEDKSITANKRGYDSFYCDCCGLCCRAVYRAPMYHYLDRGDGVCKYLGEDNLCTIYENRPIVCRVEESYERWFKNQMSKKEYYDINYQSCDGLKAEAEAKAKGIQASAESVTVRVTSATMETLAATVKLIPPSAKEVTSTTATDDFDSLNTSSTKD